MNNTLSRTLITDYLLWLLGVIELETLASSISPISLNLGLSAFEPS